MLDKLLELLLLVWSRLRVMTVVDADEHVVVLRWGRVHNLLTTGPHPIMPVADCTRRCKSVQGTMRMHEQSLTTVDGKDLTLSPIVTWKVTNPQAYMVDTDGASAIDDVTYGTISEWVHRNTLDYVRDPSNWGELCRKVRAAAEFYGVYVVRVRFGDLTRSKTLRLLGNTSGL